MALLWKTLALPILAVIARGESAVLECTADARLGDGTHLFQFRLPLVEGWKIRKATLLLHPMDPPPPPKLSISMISGPWTRRTPAPALGRAANVIPKAYGGGWIRLDLDPRLIRPSGLAIRAVKGTPYRFHRCESVQHSPYLLIEGESPAIRHSR